MGAVKQKNMTMTFSVLASGWPPHKTYKWKDVRKLVQYATDHYERREIIADTSKIKEISIKNGLKEKVLLKTGNLKAAFLVKKTKLITIQRSKGYQTRPSFSVAQIGQLISFVKKIKPDVICMVDNCYGEFVETIEPSDVGAD